MRIFSIYLLVLASITPAIADPISCGSAETINLAKQIAAEHPENKLTNYVRSNPDNPAGDVSKLLDEKQEKLRTLASELKQAEDAAIEARNKSSEQKAECRRRLMLQPGTALETCCEFGAATGAPPLRPQDQEVVDMVGRSVKAEVQANFNVVKLTHLTDERRSQLARDYGGRLNALWNQDWARTQYALKTIRTKAKNPDTGELTCEGTILADVPDWGGAHMDVSFTVEKTTDGELYVTIYGLFAN
jgi:hypothetical protein